MARFMLPDKICEGCGRPFKPRVQTQKYGSLKCQGLARRNEIIRRWKSGEISGNGKYPGVLMPTIRNYIKDKFGHKCSQCGWAEVHSVTGNVPVQIDHIDGDWRNNAEENLRLLCPNCHSLTPTFRALNRD